MITSSCSKQENILLMNDNLVNNYYNSTEIAELMRIQLFFDEAIGITNMLDTDELENAYSQLFMLNKDIKQASELQIPFDEEDVRALFGKIDVDVINDIWGQNSFITGIVSEGSKDLEINANGEFVRLLKEMGEKDLQAKEYYNSLKLPGDITPNLVASLAKASDQYNIDDPKIRLLIAIHYITIRDNV